MVDSLGGLADAVAYAAKLAETDAYKTTNYPRLSDDFESFLESLQPSPFGQTAIGKSLEYYLSIVIFKTNNTYGSHPSADSF